MNHPEERMKPVTFSKIFDKSSYSQIAKGYAIQQHKFSRYFGPKLLLPSIKPANAPQTPSSKKEGKEKGIEMLDEQMHVNGPTLSNQL